MRFCVKIFNQHIDWAVAIQTCNKNRADKVLYAALKLEYSTVPSTLLKAVRETAMTPVKARHSLQVGKTAQPGRSTKLKRRARKKPTAIRYYARTITLKGTQLTLSCISKRVCGACDSHVDINTAQKIRYDYIFSTNSID